LHVPEYSHLMPVYTSILCRFIELFFSPPELVACAGVYSILCRFIQDFYAGLFNLYMPVYSCILFRFIEALYAGPELVACAGVYSPVEYTGIL
jgi:hypothetical protein